MPSPARQPGRSRGAVRALGALVLALGAALEALAAQSLSAPAPRGPTELEDVPEKHVPAAPRTEADEDRLEALVLFAAARTRQRRLDHAGALRLYQRALRCDPDSLSVARAIVPLAHRLKRFDEAARYAVKVVELEQADPMLLRALARHLVDEGDLGRAAALYEKAVAARAGEPPSVTDVVMWMELGQFYHVAGEHRKAAEQFARVLDALEHPDKYELDDKARKVLLADGGSTYQAIGESFLLDGRHQEAFSLFQKAHEAAPDQALWDFHRARVAAAEGKPAEAAEALEACLKARLAGRGAEPYELLARLLKARNKEADLLARLEGLRAGDPDNLALAGFLAEQYRGAGKLDKAQALYAEVLEKKPSLEGYRALVDIYHRTKQPDKLLDLLGEVAGKTSSLEVLGEEAKAALSDAALVDRVIGAARARLEQAEDKLSYEARLAAALLALQNKRTGVAGEFFGLALEARPEQAGELLLLWGVGLLMAEKPAEAAAVFQRGIDEKALPEGNPAMHFYLAGALELSGRTDAALAAAREAARTKPDSARFQGRAAWVLYHARQYEEAEKAYRELIDRFDSNHESAENRQVMRDARFVLSNLCVLAGRREEAVEWLNQVLDEFPDDPGALNDLGYLWADKGEHLQRALRMVRRAVEADPENRAYRDSLGWAYYRLGRFPEAVAELEKAAEGDAPDALILDHLGDACAAAGQKERAVAAWRRATEAFRKEGEADKAESVEKKIKSP